MPEIVTGDPPVCPRCETTAVAWILYGRPVRGPELEGDLEAGRVALGGCLAWKGQPDHVCTARGTRFRQGGGPVQDLGSDA